MMWQKFMYVADKDYPEEEFAEPEVKVVYDPFFQSEWSVPPTSSSTSSTSSTTSTTLPPVTEPPVTEPPTTQPPVTEPPVTTVITGPNPGV